jgi:WhiB family redox-sensing transcriptional regulator
MRATANRAGFDIGRPDRVLDNLEAERQSEEALLAVSIQMLLDARPAWQSEGACIGGGIDFTSRGPIQISAALQLCGVCPVRAACLSWAIEVDDKVAVLGGMTPAVRKRLVDANRSATIEDDSDAAA